MVEFWLAAAKLTPTAKPSGMLWTVMAMMRSRIRRQLAMMLSDVTVESN